MNHPPLAWHDASLPVLLRHAHAAYGAAMRAALADAGYDDIPKNGLYLIGGLALQKGARPLGLLIAELGMSKQAAGQLVDMLVLRGYLVREIDAQDRRKLTIALTERGRDAAKRVATARAKLDAEWLLRAGAKELERARRTLVQLVEIGHERDVQDDDEP